VNFFGRRRLAQGTPIVVLSRMPGGELRISRYEQRRLTHLGFRDSLSPVELNNYKIGPPDEDRRGYLTAEEASWDNYGRDPDAKLGVLHYNGG
jgi:hypothetical protein